MDAHATQVFLTALLFCAHILEFPVAFLRHLIQRWQEINHSTFIQQRGAPLRLLMTKGAEPLNRCPCSFSRSIGR